MIDSSTLSSFPFWSFPLLNVTRLTSGPDDHTPLNARRNGDFNLVEVFIFIQQANLTILNQVVIKWLLILSVGLISISVGALRWPTLHIY